MSLLQVLQEIPWRRCLRRAECTSWDIQLCPGRIHTRGESRRDRGLLVPSLVLETPVRDMTQIVYQKV